MYHMMANTNDGFLFTSIIPTHPEFADEMSFNVSKESGKHTAVTLEFEH